MCLQETVTGSGQLELLESTYYNSVVNGYMLLDEKCDLEVIYDLNCSLHPFMCIVI